MGYQDALSLATQKLAQLSAEAVCKNCGARYEGGEYSLPWFNSLVLVTSASVTHQILWLHYLTATGVKEPVGRLIAYREMASALFYESKFIHRAVKPMVNYFGAEPKKLVKSIMWLGGHENRIGDASATVNVLPYLPITFVLWEGDEEMSPEGSILFDQGVKSWFVPEDLAVLSSLAVYELISADKKINETSLPLL